MTMVYNHGPNECVVADSGTDSRRVQSNGPY